MIDDLNDLMPGGLSTLLEQELAVDVVGLPVNVQKSPCVKAEKADTVAPVAATLNEGPSD